VRISSSLIELQENVFLKKIIYILSGGLSLFVVVAVAFYIMEPERKLSVFLSASLILVFMSKPLSERFYGRIVDLLLILVSTAAGVYFYADYWNLIYRVGTPNTLDIILGFGVVLVILEATRRTVGMPLVIIIITFSFMPSSVISYPYSFPTEVIQLAESPPVFL